MAAGLAIAAAIWHRGSVHPQLKVVYLVPKGVTPQAGFEDGARRAVLAAQRWYFDELERGVSFALAEPLVETIRTDHTEEWYRSAADVPDRRKDLFWTAVSEASQVTGGTYDDWQYVWLYFLDADLPAIPPQGTSGVALLLRDDIRNILGPRPKCSAVGVMVHELGHAFRVDHPPECDSHEKDDSAPECVSMSYLGDRIFPRARFLPQDRRTLLAHFAFVAVKPQADTVDCVQ